MSPSRPLSFRDDYKAGDDLQGLFLLFVNWRGVAIHHTGLGHKMMVFCSILRGTQPSQTQNVDLLRSVNCYRM